MEYVKEHGVPENIHRQKLKSKQILNSEKIVDLEPSQDRKMDSREPNCRCTFVISIFQDSVNDTRGISH